LDFLCGHGSEGKRELISNVKEYLHTFLKVTSAAQSRKEAIGKTKELFHGFAPDEFLLVHSVNFHVKENSENARK
jgi:hypothetical protein